MSDVRILEVGPRDGLQNEKVLLSLKDKVEMVRNLAQSGLKKIELGAFVSPKAIPQMESTEDVVIKILELQKQKEISDDIEFTALVPNLKGLDRLLKTGLKETAIFMSCTDSFSEKNINCNVKESLKIYKEVSKQALDQGLKVRAYLSVCFSCPYEGVVSPQRVVDLVQEIQNFGVYEISISDTIGVATPIQIQTLFNLLKKKNSLDSFALHCHDVHGTALANIWTAYQMGIKSFDGSVGGLGGCPYAGVKTGNVATESLFYLFEGEKSPVIQHLVEIGRWLEARLDKSLSSPLLRSPYYKK